MFRTFLFHLFHSTLFQIAEKKSPFLLIFIYVMPVRLYIFQL